MGNTLLFLKRVLTYLPSNESFDVPNTGGWQNWETIESLITINSSVKTLKIVVKQGGFNINYLAFKQYAVINVSGVSIEAAATIDEGQSYSLAAVISPSNASDQTVTWSSDDAFVASVNEHGVVTAHNPGYANISVYTHDGNFSSTCAIQVNEAPIVNAILIQAEDYTEMSGVQTENTTDIDGGLNVGWTDGGDWMAYSVEIPTSGNYTIEYRVASQNGGGELQLEQLGGVNAYGVLSIPATGGWQEWTTISHTVSLNAGEQDIAIAVKNGGWNINWLKISSSTNKKASLENLSTEPVNLSIYPNPAHDQLSINGLSNNSFIEIYSVSGVKVLQSNESNINIESIIPGIYFITVNNNGQISRHRFIKE